MTTTTDGLNEQDLSGYWDEACGDCGAEVGVPCRPGCETGLGGPSLTPKPPRPSAADVLALLAEVYDVTEIPHDGACRGTGWDEEDACVPGCPRFRVNAVLPTETKETP